MLEGHENSNLPLGFLDLYRRKTDSKTPRAEVELEQDITQAIPPWPAGCALLLQVSPVSVAKGSPGRRSKWHPHMAWLDRLPPSLFRYQRKGEAPSARLPSDWSPNIWVSPATPPHLWGTCLSGQGCRQAGRQAGRLWGWIRGESSLLPPLTSASWQAPAHPREPAPPVAGLFKSSLALLLRLRPTHSAAADTSCTMRTSGHFLAVPLLPLLLLLLLALGAHLSSSAPQGSKAKAGYCYNMPPLGDVFDEKDCSACQKNGTCSTCASDSQCPETQKCCPGDCGYVCQEAIFDFCHLPSVCGNCKAMFSRFFYNSSSQKCEQFIYGGCGGNKNNFETEDECLKMCFYTRAT